GLAFDFSFFAAVLRAVGAPSSADVAAAAAPADCSEAVAAGARFGRGCACLLGFLPSVKISLMRTSVNSWRWPILRRDFLRRRFLKAIMFGPRPCSRTAAGGMVARMAASNTPIGAVMTGPQVPVKKCTPSGLRVVSCFAAPSSDDLDPPAVLKREILASRAVPGERR